MFDSSHSSPIIHHITNSSQCNPQFPIPIQLLPSISILQFYPMFLPHTSIPFYSFQSKPIQHHLHTSILSHPLPTLYSIQSINQTVNHQPLMHIHIHALIHTHIYASTPLNSFHHISSNPPFSIFLNPNFPKSNPIQ